MAGKPRTPAQVRAQKKAAAASAAKRKRGQSLSESSAKLRNASTAARSKAVAANAKGKGLSNKEKGAINQATASLSDSRKKRAKEIDSMTSLNVAVRQGPLKGVRVKGWQNDPIRRKKSLLKSKVSGSGTGTLD